MQFIFANIKTQVENIQMLDCRLALVQIISLPINFHRLALPPVRFYIEMFYIIEQLYGVVSGELHHE